MDQSGKPETRNGFQSYLNRVRGLQKKIHQFSTLVDVDACMIAYGPRQATLLPDTYPENLRDVIRIAKRYLSLPKAERTKRHIDLSNVSGDDGKNKTGDDNSNEPLVSVRDNNHNSKAADGLEWDDQFDQLSVDQMQQLIDSVETKIETIEEKIQFMEDAESRSCITSRISDHGVGAATTTTTSRGPDTSMHMQPAYVLQPMNSDNGNNGVTTNGSNVSYPMVMSYRMMAVQPGGGNQTEFGNQQGQVTYFLPQVYVQPMTTSYIPNLMPGGAYPDA